MRGWRHLLTLWAVILVFGASFALLSTVIGITSPWLALLLMFYFLVIAKVAEPLFLLSMPRALYQIREWEREGVVSTDADGFTLKDVAALRRACGQLESGEQPREPRLLG